MLNIFIQQPQGLARTTPGSPPRIPDEAIWVDLLEPTPEEEKLVEAHARRSTCRRARK